jgi:hypothetical protein
MKQSIASTTNASSSSFVIDSTREIHSALLNQSSPIVKMEGSKDMSPPRRPAPFSETLRFGGVGTEGIRGPGFVGGYSPHARKERIEWFVNKRNNRVWKRKVKYDVRKSFADSRLRVKGRFVKKEDEELLRDYMKMV